MWTRLCATGAQERLSSGEWTLVSVHPHTPTTPALLYPCSALGKVAEERGCERMDWQVLDWNA